MTPVAGPSVGSAEPEASSGTSAAGTVLRNASLLTVATVLARLSAFGLAIVMARTLGAESYGRYGLALAVGTVLVPLADFGMTPFVSREAARARSTADAAVRALVVVKLALMAAVLVATGAVATLAVDNGELVAVLLAVLLGMLADGLSQFAFGYFQGRERMGFEAAVSTVTAILRSVGGAALVIATGDLLPVVAWLLLASLGQLAYCAWRLAAELGPASTATAAPTPVRAIPWRVVGAMGLIHVFVMIYLRADAVLIGLVLGEREVGWYTAAYTLLLGLQIVPYMIAVALTPVFARAHAGDRALFNASWQEGIRAVLIVALPVAVVTSVLAGPIIGRFFGTEFDPAVSALAILVGAIPLAALNVVVGAALRGAGRERWLTAVSGIGAALNVGLNLWAIPTFGIDGAAVVTVATELAVVLGLTSLAVRGGVAPPPRIPVVRLALALAALAGVAELARSGGPELAAAAGLVVYVLVVLATRIVGTEDLATVRAMRSGPA